MIDSNFHKYFKDEKKKQRIKAKGKYIFIYYRQKHKNAFLKKNRKKHRLKANNCIFAGQKHISIIQN